ncbi:hypothetical protein AAZV13_13G304300 [Glycine max]
MSAIGFFTRIIGRLDFWPYSYNTLSIKFPGMLLAKCTCFSPLPAWLFLICYIVTNISKALSSYHTRGSVIRKILVPNANSDFPLFLLRFLVITLSYPIVRIHNLYSGLDY